MTLHLRQQLGPGPGRLGFGLWEPWWWVRVGKARGRAGPGGTFYSETLYSVALYSETLYYETLYSEAGKYCLIHMLLNSNPLWQPIPWHAAPAAAALRCAALRCAAASCPSLLLY